MSFQSFCLPLPQHHVIGHRGAIEQAPENTEASIRSALALNLSWIEIDLQFTADGHGIIFHDQTLERAADRALEPSTALWSDVQQPIFEGHTILTLARLMKLITSSDLIVNLEIKLFYPHQRDTYLEWLKPLLEIWPQAHRPCLSSFDHVFLHAWESTYPDWPTIWLTEKADSDTLAHCLADPARRGLGVDHTRYTPEALSALAEQYAVFAYTVNEPERFQALRQAGVQGIFTDRPSLFLP